MEKFVKSQTNKNLNFRQNSAPICITRLTSWGWMTLYLKKKWKCLPYYHFWHLDIWLLGEWLPKLLFGSKWLKLIDSSSSWFVWCFCDCSNCLIGVGDVSLVVNYYYHHQIWSPAGCSLHSMTENCLFVNK